MARKRRPKDPVQVAQLVGDIATGRVPNDSPPTPEEVRRVMSALGKIGGPKGGKARAEKLSKKRRSDIAKQAAIARWSADDKDRD